MQVHLRPLEEKDAPLMLEWMTDPSITEFFRFDASDIKIENCLTFIEASKCSDTSFHFAIADSQDTYLGTISLKDIDYTERTAEYAVSTRKCAHGTGAALQATKQLLHFAFDKLKLENVFLNVLTENVRANSFYQKAGFQYVFTQEHALEKNGEWKSLNWYKIYPQDLYRKD